MSAYLATTTNGHTPTNAVITPIFITVSADKADIMKSLGLSCELYVDEDFENYTDMDYTVIWSNEDAAGAHALKRGLVSAGAKVRGLYLDKLFPGANRFDWLSYDYTSEYLLDAVARLPYLIPPVGITEDKLAWLFADRYKGELRFCHEFNAWFHWTGSRWKKEKTKLAFNYVREICREQNIEGKATLGKATTASGVLQFAQADRVLVADADIWDTDLYLLGTPGGTVNLRTGELQPARQSDMITKQCAVTPAKTSDCPRWKQFLNEATQGDNDLQYFMQQVAGYALTGDISEHALFFIYGPGGNGKSVFLNTLNNIAGDYATTAAMDTFTASRSEKHPTDLAMLRGARVVSVSETEEGRAWAESRIKQLTGGDRVAARFMRGDFFQYLPQFKLLIVGNHAPMLHNVDDAMKRRFNIIPFIHKPEKPDHELEQKLKSEYPAILRWAIEGCLYWQAQGLIRPESVQAATAEYFEGQDLFGQWLLECCEPGDYIETRLLYDSWSSFAKRNGEDVGDIRKFGPLLSKRGYAPIKKENKRCIKGLMLKKKDDWHDKYDY